MRLEYLRNGAPECPLIRFFRFTMTEAEALRTAIETLTNDQAVRVDVDLLPFVESVGGCRLAVCADRRDLGLIERGQHEFECILTPDRWSDVCGLIEPFGEHCEPGYYQWLFEAPGLCPILLSVDGSW